MEELIKDLDNNKLQAQNKEVSIFFSDIRGFTNISEKIDRVSTYTLIKTTNKKNED